MSEITTVVLDAMGGDNAPAAMIDGAIDAISKEKNVKVILVGIEDVIRKGLEGQDLQSRADRDRECDRSDRDSRAAGTCYTQEERFFHRSRDEACKRGKSRCFCICRKFRRDSCGRTGDRWQNQRC